MRAHGAEFECGWRLHILNPEMPGLRLRNPRRLESSVCGEKGLTTRRRSAIDRDMGQPQDETKLGPSPKPEKAPTSA